LNRNLQRKEGHFCHYCGESKPNESFSGKGHRRHLCRECQSIPVAEREEMEILGRLFDLMEQSHISKKNVTWLQSLQLHQNELVRKEVELILHIAEVAPYRKKRYKRIQLFSTNLLRDCIEAGLLYSTEVE
jgi:hypothetical protein